MRFLPNGLAQIMLKRHSRQLHLTTHVPRRKPMAGPADVAKMIKDNEVKFVDLRFTDTRGKEQHVSVPTKAFDDSKFTDGHAFDGSSIAGWKGIQASDMLLMPDPDSANLDPFTDEPTLILTCDVVEPSDGKGYDRDPRSIAKRGEAYLKSSGIGDTAYFGPEPEFFIFDSVTWNVDMSGSFVKIRSEEAPWSSGEDFEGGNMGHRPAIKGGYFPVPPVDSLQDIRSAMCLAMEEMGVEVEVHHHEVQQPGQARRLVADHEVRHPQRRAFVRQDGHVHAEAGRRRQRLGHARAPVDLERRPKPLQRQRLLGPVRDGALLHRRRHQARQGAERDHQSRHELVQASRPRFRSADQPRVLRA
jgi:hypothetical protein